MTRRLALHLTLVAALALCLAPAAPGQPLTKLWSEYPLYQSGSAEPRGVSPTSLPAAEPKQWLRADTRAEAVGPTAATAPDPVPWSIVGVLSAGAVVLAFLLFARMIPAPAVSWSPSSLSGRVARLAVDTRERSRRGSPRQRNRAPARRAVPRPPSWSAPPVESAENDDPPEAGRPGPGWEQEQGQEVCTVRWWRGYVKSQFIAEAKDSAGRVRVVGQSPEFWWRRPEPPPRSGPALDAHKSLLASLERDGWETPGQPVGPWFAATLWRPERPSLHALADRLSREADARGGA
jgi:hypothetical protein